MIDRRVRYLQLAFNDDLGTALGIVYRLPKEERILVEAGTPFIKKEGMRGVWALRKVWPHGLVADIKTTDGGAEEVEMIARAGATAATVMGSCPTETIRRFIEACEYFEVDSLIDMLGVNDRHIARTRPPRFGAGPLSHELGDGEYVLARKPDLIIFGVPRGQASAKYLSGRQMQADPDFFRLYRLVYF